MQVNLKSFHSYYIAAPHFVSRKYSGRKNFEVLPSKMLKTRSRSGFFCADIFLPVIFGGAGGIRTHVSLHSN